MASIDRHEPTRSCVGCRRRRPARDLVRVTRSVDGDHRGASVVQVDGPSNGRGAWLCRSAEGGVDARCRETAIEKRQFTRAWRSTVTETDVAAIRDAT